MGAVSSNAEFVKEQFTRAQSVRDLEDARALTPPSSSGPPPPPSLLLTVPSPGSGPPPSPIRSPLSTVIISRYGTPPVVSARALRRPQTTSSASSSPLLSPADASPSPSPPSSGDYRKLAPRRQRDFLVLHEVEQLPNMCLTNTKGIGCSRLMPKRIPCRFITSCHILCS